MNDRKRDSIRQYNPFYDRSTSGLWRGPTCKFNLDRALAPPERNQFGEWLEKGTRVKGAHLQGAHLRLPGLGDKGPTLEIYQYTSMQEKPSPVANRKGFGHIAFRVGDVEAMQQRVIEHGGKNLGELSTSKVPGVGLLTFLYMVDPEDNIIEIFCWS